MSFDLLARCHPRASYLIAAKSNSRTAMEALQAHIDSLECRDRIRLEVNRTDVPDLLAAADLFLYATPQDSSDSLPRALLEAQAAVAYDADAVAAAASELLADERAARRMADEGSRSVRERFQWDAMADAYEELFLRVANHGNS